MTAARARRAVFLDRDGTLDQDSPEYVKSVEELEIYPDAPPALRRLHEAGFALVVVTNQSAIARGLTTAEEVARMHDRLRAVFARAGAPILDFVLCPHHPDDGCRCRKPQPGLVEDACARHEIDPRRSWLVGDKESDVEAGARAGCRTVLLARGDTPPPAAGATRADLVCRDLAAAAEAIIREGGGRG